MARDMKDIRGRALKRTSKSAVGRALFKAKGGTVKKQLGGVAQPVGGATPAVGAAPAAGTKTLGTRPVPGTLRGSGPHCAAGNFADGKVVRAVGLRTFLGLGTPRVSLGGRQRTGSTAGGIGGGDTAHPSRLGRHYVAPLQPL